jgi:hypothetical protein
MFFAALFTIAKMCEQPKYSLRDKENMASLCSGISFIHKNNEIVLFVATWMTGRHFNQVK